MSQSRAISAMKKQSWRIFKRNGLVLNAFATAVIFASTAAVADMPAGGNWVAGGGNTVIDGNTMNINQNGQYGIIQWGGGFNIANGNTVNFNNGTGATLNQDISGNGSFIDGNLNATGSVYVQNANGVIVGPNGNILTGGSFVATTRDISHDDFLNGRNNFNGTSDAGVVNQGNIKSVNGDVILVGRYVSNSGSIEAGRNVFAAAGDQVLLTDTGTGNANMHVAVADASAAQAALQANGGNVYGLAINNTGVIKANQISNVNGQVVLSSAVGTTQNAGSIDTSSANGNGGNVTVTGQNVIAAAGSSINASGYNNGGNINLGGGWQGADANIQNAQNTTVEAGATLTSNAVNGDAGQVAVWSDNTTVFRGAVSAASTNGKGGSVEISGKEILNIDTLQNINVAGGSENGLLLLDPTNINILSGNGPDLTSGITSNNTLYDTDISNWLNNNSNLVILTSSAGAEAGDINFGQGVNIAWGSNNTLTLNAIRDINLANTIINAGAANGTANIIFNAGRDINFTENALLSAGKQGAIMLNAASGQWHAGTGSINFASTATLIADKIFLRSGITDGNRTDLTSAVKFGNHDGAYGSFEISGFNNVDINAGATNKVITEGGSVVINARNILINEDYQVGGDLILNAGAFDDDTNVFTAEGGRVFTGTNPFSDGWKQNTGTITFETTGANSVIDFDVCCGVTLTSGVDANGNRVDLTPDVVNFSYNNATNEYKWFEAKGFGTFQTVFEGGTLTTIDHADVNRNGFVKIINDDNVIDFNVNAHNNVLVIANNSTEVKDVNVTSGTDITFVVDENTPLAPGAGQLNVSAGANFTAPVIALYTSQQANNSINGTFNGQTFSEGQEFVETSIEKWLVFYQNNFNGNPLDDTAGANPFIVYYKNNGTPFTPRGDCSANPQAAGCENFVEFTETGKEYRVALTQDSTTPEEGALAWGNSSMVRNNEFYTIKSYDYVDTNLTTSEKISTFWYALPIQLVNIPLTGAAAIPGIQSIAEGLKSITGGIQSGLDSVVR